MQEQPPFLCKQDSSVFPQIDVSELVDLPFPQLSDDCQLFEKEASRGAIPELEPTNELTNEESKPKSSTSISDTQSEKPEPVVVTAEDSVDNIEPANAPVEEAAPAKGKKEKRTWDNFRVKRDCFRGFSSYYKNKFKKWNKIWQAEKRNKKKKQDMRLLTQRFLAEEFGNSVNELPEDQLDALIKPMTIILHSHRYQKREEFTDGLDFSIIRNLIYSYSQEARETFMADPMMAFLFNHFCLEGKTQLVSKSQGKTSLYVLEIESEMAVLQAESARALAF